jgi:hypothetical protein
VPAATILSLFGFRAQVCRLHSITGTVLIRFQAFWWPDIVTLVVMFASLIVLSFLALVFLVKEKR